MIRFATSGMGVSFATLASAAQTFVAPPELWDRPRSGQAVLEQPAIRQAVNASLAQPGSRLIVRHATGQESLLAAEELRSWLGALAVEPGRISSRSGLQRSEPLRIEVVGSGDK